MSFPNLQTEKLRQILGTQVRAKIRLTEGLGAERHCSGQSPEAQSRWGSWCLCIQASCFSLCLLEGRG